MHNPARPLFVGSHTAKLPPNIVDVHGNEHYRVLSVTLYALQDPFRLGISYTVAN